MSDEKENIESYLTLLKSKHSWYFWGQNRETTIKEYKDLNINFNIEATDVEIFQASDMQISHGIYPLEEVIKLANTNGKDVIQVSSSPRDKPPVIIARFESLRELYFPEIGLYSKPRPWIVNNGNNKEIGIKVVQDGIPRSSKVAESDFTNEDEIFKLAESNCFISDTKSSTV